jgi:hypothetical protein
MAFAHIFGQMMTRFIRKKSRMTSPPPKGALSQLFTKHPIYFVALKKFFCLLFCVHIIFLLLTIKSFKWKMLYIICPIYLRNTHFTWLFLAHTKIQLRERNLGFCVGWEGEKDFKYLQIM